MRIFRKIMIAGVIVLSLSAGSFAEDAAIRNVVISNSSNHLAIQFELTNGFNDKMDEAIQNGIPTLITYHIELYQSQSWWNDKLLMSVTMVKTIKLDNLKKEYVVSVDSGSEHGESNTVFATFQEARKVVSRVDIHRLYPMWKLERNKSYYFRVKAESKGVEPPPYMHYLLFFLKWRNFETDWMIEKFTY